MSWHSDLKDCNQKIDQYHIYSIVQRNGSTRFFAGGLFLEYTLAYRDDGVDLLSRFMADYRLYKNSGDGEGCPVCGRPMTGRPTKAVYCSVSCYNTAKWRRMENQRRAS